jgi:hypothetical protein
MVKLLLSSHHLHFPFIFIPLSLFSLREEHVPVLFRRNVSMGYFGSVEDPWGKSLTEAQRGRGKRLKD